MRLLAAVLAALSLVACEAAPPGEPSPSPPTATAEPTLDAEAEMQRVMELRSGWGLESDREWVERVHADPESVMSPLGIPVTPDELAALDRIVAEDPRSALIMYGARNWRQFGGLWVNEPGVGTVMLFSADLERHRQAIAAIAGDQRFEVRPARFTEHELRTLQDALGGELVALPGVEFLSLGLDTRNNMLHLEIKSNDPTFGPRLEAQHEGRLRVSVHPLPGAWQNTAEGAGWRLLAVGTKRGGEGYAVHAATDEPAWRAMWSDLDPVNEAPAVDMDNEIVVAFLHGIGSSCPELRLVDVVIDHAAQLVYSVTADPLAPRNCTADLAGSAYFVVALARDALPADQFTLALERQTLCGSCPQERIEIELP